MPLRLLLGFVSLVLLGVATNPSSVVLVSRVLKVEGTSAEDNTTKPLVVGEVRTIPHTGTYKQAPWTVRNRFREFYAIENKRPHDFIYSRL